MLRKLRFYYRFVLALLGKEWRKITFGLLFLGVLAYLIIVIAPFTLSYFKNIEAKYLKPTYVEAVVGRPSTFNPLFSNDESEKEINSLVFRGLTKVDPNGKIVSDLAESFKNLNDTTYQFNLRKDVYWQDGVKFTADDVVYTVETAQNPLYHSKIANNFRDVEVKKVDDYTILFKLKEPFAPFVSATTVGIIPKHIPLTNYRPVGTGEFKFVEIGKDKITLEGNKVKLVFKSYPNLDLALTALKLGEVHGLVGTDETREALIGWKNFNTDVSVLPYQLVTAFFNTKNDFLNEKLVRQALTYAIPKEQIVKGPSGTKGTVAFDSLPDLPMYQTDSKEHYPFDLKKAASDLNNLGWVLNNGVRMKEGRKMSLTITTLKDTSLEDTATKIQQAWKNLGIEVNLKFVSDSEMKDQVVPNRIFDVLITQQVLDPDPDQYVLWHTTQIQESNLSSISSPKIDKLLEDGRKTLVPNLRNDLYHKFTRILLDEDPAVFLYYPNYIWIHSTRIGNIDLSRFRWPVDRFENADNWEIKRPLI